MPRECVSFHGAAGTSRQLCLARDWQSFSKLPRMAEQFVVRQAGPADGAGIAHVHVQAWREAYAHALPAATLAGLDENALAVSWAHRIANGLLAFVAQADSQTVGWATTSTGRDPDSPVPCELEGLYILQSLYGTGVGQLLLDAAIGSQPAYVWMLDDNPRAEAFYRKNRFTRDGAEMDGRMAGTLVHVVRFIRH